MLSRPQLTVLQLKCLVRFFVAGMQSQSKNLEGKFELSTPHLSFLMSHMARNSFFPLPQQERFEDKQTSLDTIKMVGPTALGLNPSLIRVPSFSDTQADAGRVEMNFNFDILDIPNDTNAIKPGEDGNNFDLILLDENCFPGYARLEPKEPGKWGRYVAEEDGIMCLKHIRSKDRLTRVGPVCMQTFLAFKSKWPEVAEDWVARERQCRWPRKHIVDIIVRNGCHFIAPNHQTAETLWKYSFASAEKTIMTYALSESMKSCFAVFKALLDYAFKECKLNIDLLLSVLFYCCEEMPLPSWRNEPVNCLMRLLQKLKEFLLHEHFPNYFVHYWNILDDVEIRAPAEWYKAKIDILENNIFVSILR